MKDSMGLFKFLATDTFRGCKLVYAYFEYNWILTLTLFNLFFFTLRIILSTMSNLLTLNLHSYLRYESSKVKKVQYFVSESGVEVESGNYKYLEIVLKYGTYLVTFYCCCKCIIRCGSRPPFLQKFNTEQSINAVWGPLPRENYIEYKCGQCTVCIIIDLKFLQL